MISGWWSIYPGMEGATGGFLGTGAEGLEGGEVSPPNPAGAPLPGLRAAPGLGSPEKFPPAWNSGAPVAKTKCQSTQPHSCRTDHAIRKQCSNACHA